MKDRAMAPQDVPYSAYFAHTVRRAFSIAARRGSAIVGLEHLLYALLDDPNALALMEGCDADIASIRVEIGNVIEKTTPRKLLGKNETPQTSKGVRHVLMTAEQGAREAGRAEVDGAIAVAALVGQSDTPIARTLNKHGLSFGKALGWIDSQSTRGAPPAEAAPQPERSPAPRKTAPPPRPAPSPAKRSAPPPARPRQQPEHEPTLEDMLATIRDVIDEDDDAPPARETSASPPPRDPPPASAGDVAPSRGRRQDNGQAPAPAPRQARRSAPNGAAGSAKRRAPAPQPQEQPDTSPTLGKLVERIPRVMREGVREQVEVRIAREATEELLVGIQGSGATHVHGVAVTRAMSLYLRAPDGGFMIEPLTPETQWVFDRPSFLDSEPFGRWLWVVLPMKRGSRRLQLVAAARSIDENGMIGDVALPEQVIDISVKINWARSLRKIALWAGLAVAGGVLAQMAIRYVPGLAG
jgi:hypothetical protein